MLRRVLETIEVGGIQSRIYELPEGETMESCTFVDRCLISMDVMRHILIQADEEFARQSGGL